MIGRRFTLPADPVPAIILLLPLLMTWACSPGDEVRESTNRVGGVAVESSLPRFEDYPAADIYRGPTAPVDFSGYSGPPRARDRILHATAGGANFAGGFVAVPLDCGIGCIDVVIVDARTGAVHESLSGVPPIYYRLDSDLLVVEASSAPPGQPRCAGCTAVYFVWRGDHLEKIPEGSWMDAPPSDEVHRSLEGYRSGEAALLAAEPAAAKRPRVDRLVIDVDDGSVRVFEDDIIADQVLRFYRYHGTAGSLAAHVVERVLIPEGWQFFLVDAADGRVTEIDDVPVGSPDGARFMTASMDLVAGHRPNRARIYGTGRRGPVVEWEISPDGWGITEPRWLDDRTIAFTRVELDTTSTPFTERRSEGRLNLQDGRWTLR